MDKQAFRNKILNILKDLDEATRGDRMQKISTKLFQLEIWKQATCIGTTISQFPELDTQMIIEQAWLEKKQIVVPKANPRLKTMDFKKIIHNDQLEKGYAAIMEPKQELPSILPSQIDLLIVPGVVYREDGYRIGFGGGYYDRFLQTYKGKTISIAFDEQITSAFEIESHDIPVQMIITDKRIIHCNKK